MSNERLFTSSSAIGLQLGATGQVVTELQGFLRKFGYLQETEASDFAAARDSTVPDAAPGTFDDATEEALRNYQKFHGLPITGELDRATVAEMRKPRCGFPDQPSSIGARFDAPGSRWERTDLTYRVVNFSPDLSQAEIRDAMRQAFDLWSAVSPLRFKEVDGNADILINFAPNDGAGKVLAYAYFPPIGDSSFDEDETWTINVPTPQGRVDLVTVAAHEFGHSLGLGHSTFAEAIMFPSYSGPHRFLAPDDVDGIQFLYGRPSDRRRRSPVTNVPLGAIARKPEQQDLFLVGEDGRVYTSWWTEGVTDWTGVNDNWRSLGGIFPAGAPVSSVSRKPNHLDLFVVGNDGRVYSSWWIEGVTDWTGVNDNWRSLGGIFPAGAPVSSVSRKPDHLDLFVIGNDGRVYSSWFIEGGTDWTGVNDNWRSLGGIFPVGARVSVVSRKPEHLDLFVIGEDGRVYSSWFIEGVTDWTGVNDNWRSLGGIFPVGAPVTAVSRKPGHLDLFVIGNDGRVYSSWFIEGVTDWTGVNDNWRPLGGSFPVGARVTAVSRKPEHLDLFVVGNDGRVYSSWFIEGVTDWTGVNDNWRSLGGIFPVGAPVGAISRKPGDLALFVIGNDRRVYSSWLIEGVTDWTGINDNWRPLGGFFPIPHEA